MPDVDAAAELGIAMTHFWKCRKQYGIPSYFQRSGLRKNKKDGTLYRFHDYNEDFFEVIDSPEKAYFLGLLATDGNISPRLTAVRIALKDNDEYILERFRKALGEGAPRLATKISKINGVPSHPQKCLALSRIKMVKDLIGHGITPRKSLDLLLKTSLPLELKSHFLRGAWDGDGSVTQRRFKITTASYGFAVQLQDLIRDVSGRQIKIVTDKCQSSSVLYHLCGYKKDAAIICAIYGDSDLAIPRKREAYLRYWASGAVGLHPPVWRV